jgi:hypothetical protein
MPTIVIRGHAMDEKQQPSGVTLPEADNGTVVRDDVSIIVFSWIRRAPLIL